MLSKMENQKIFFGGSREFSGNYRRNHSGGGVLGGGGHLTHYVLIGGGHLTHYVLRF